jgi:protein required for attachment to host cells
MTHVRIRHGDWVFVGDGRKALLLRNEGDPDLLDLRRVEVREDDNPPSREQGSDGPGRSAVNIGPRSAIDTTDWHALEEERFAATIAERLNRAAEENRFEHIVIAAPPKVLGELRREYSKKLQGKIVAEIDKDLTHHTFPDIAKVLGTRGV